ncbi:MAG: nucleoside phosphorylase [Halobacteriaceae archaeon]
MPVPNHPDKHASTPVITPDESGTHLREDITPPSAIVLCYSPSLFEYVTDTYDGHQLDAYFGDLYVLPDDVGVLGNFGIGAPTTAMQMEELIADGATAFLSIGFAGALETTIDRGEYILCSRAIRDDGTSHHYLPADRDASPSDALHTHVATTLEEYPVTVHEGPTWTIDAVYRETEAEVRTYADRGVLTVEMEAAAVFAVASHHDIEAASVFVVSDYVTPEDWTPHFEAATEDLYDLGDTAVDLLAGFPD